MLDVDKSNPVTQVEPVVVNETVSVRADVTITPDAAIGEIQSFCAAVPVIQPCPENPLAFRVSQDFCIQIPLTLSAIVAAVPAGIACGAGRAGISGKHAAYVQPRCFFLSRPDVTNALINAAGGSIILGKAGSCAGLSLSVTTANARGILSLNTPGPPDLISDIFAHQYKYLYAELLTANLNILNGASSLFVAEAIEGANSFLAGSPVGGMEGALSLQAPLAQFNLGLAQGC